MIIASSSCCTARLKVVALAVLERTDLESDMAKEVRNSFRRPRQLKC